MLHVPGGQFVRGEVSTADASGGVAATLYDNQGNVVTLLATQRIILYSAVIVAAVSGNVALTDNTDAAGNRILKGTVGTNGGIAVQFPRPVELHRGVVPKLFAAAGQADLTFVAELIDS